MNAFVFFFAALGDEKMSSPAGSIKTESSVPFDGFSPLNNDHEERQGEEAIKNVPRQLPNVEKVPEVDGPASPSSGEQTSTVSSATPVAPTSTSVKTEVQTPLSETYRSGSPGAEMVPPAQEQSIVKEETGSHAAVAAAAAEPKTEDMEDTSRNSTPFPAHLNPGMNQDEDSQLSFNQESQSSEASIFAVRWPKVRRTSKSRKRNSTALVTRKCTWCPLSFSFFMMLLINLKLIKGNNIDSCREFFEAYVLRIAFNQSLCS